MEKFVEFEKGDVVVFQFPFSDTGVSKKRPGLVVAKLKGNDLILCQITKQPRPDPDLIELNLKDFQSGRINQNSFIRPSILFTVRKSRIEYKAGKLRQEKINEVQNRLCQIFTR
jgi:mRNA interferase MazF